MKSLTEYLTECEASLLKYIDVLESEADGKGGHYEDFVDEDTGEIVTLWVEDPDPELEKLKWETYEKHHKEVQALWKKCKEQEKTIAKELEKFEDELWGYEQDLKDVKRQYRQLQLDQDEEVGALYAAEKFKEGEEKAQEYGEKFNKLADEIESLKKKIKQVQPKIAKLEDDRMKIWEPYYKADEEDLKKYNEIMGK